jgi:hypothetical protein
VQPASLAVTGKEYAPTAYVPVGPWHDVAEGAGAPEVSSADPSVPRCGVFRMPGFDQKLWVDIARLQEIDPSRFDRAIAGVRHAIVADVQALFDGAIPPVIHGFNSDQGDELTVTVDQDIGWRVGLHLDSWEGGGFDERDRTMTRLCINFGPGDRYFLFVPLAPRRVLSCLPRSIREDCAADFKLTIAEFFRLHPNAPVMRLLVQPGCGYFADTDNMIHDGSTISIKDGNTNFTLRGRFLLLN